jgi:hypothetical protein
MRLLTLLLLLFATSAAAQTAHLSGKVLDDAKKPVESASVQVTGEPTGTTTNQDGEYELDVPAGKKITVNVSFVGFETQKHSLKLEPGDRKTLNVTFKSASTQIGEVTVRRRRRVDTNQAGNVYLDLSKVHEMATPGDAVSTMIKMTVGDNNELSNQYKVRGGNYDENLVYVNDFEIYRPYLIRSGQQEGLGFVNPDLVNNVNFSIGGFQARYGDKMSSVLDVTYKRPTKFGGSVMGSLLGFGMSLEGASKNQKFTYLFGARQKSNQYVLQSQPTKGVYNPSFTDIQLLMNYRFNSTWEMEVIGNYARNRFSLIPEESTTSFGVIDQAYQLRVFYDGQEIDRFDSRFGGISVTNRPNDRLKLKFLASGFQTDERETFDLSGEYLLGALETDLGKESFGQIKYAIGTGVIQNYARNFLKVNVGTLSHRGSYDGGRHYIMWGADASYTGINDKLHQWERRDSAGYNQPYNPDQLNMLRFYNSSADISYIRYSGFIQDNFFLGSDSNRVNISAGLRVLYSDINKELDLSPRIQATYKPLWKTDVLFKLSAGVYVQPPFYREMRAYDGSLNTDLRSQKSFHLVAGAEHNFKWGNRWMKLTGEAYYKGLTDLVPYVYEDVRIRYAANNEDIGYAYGGEVRLYGELVKDATSWVSLGLMNTQEDILNDKVVYQGVAGNDSAILYPGYTPRPTDQRAMFGLYLNDYLPHNKNFGVHLSLLYSTGIPFYRPDNARTEPILRLPDYKRVDIGFSALCYDKARNHPKSGSPLNALNSIWASLEVFNLLGIQNTISYTYIQDQTTGRYFAVPNHLTSRLINVKLIVRF